MFNTPAKLARSGFWGCLMVINARLVKAALTLALNVEPESLSEIGRLPYVKAGID